MRRSRVAKWVLGYVVGHYTLFLVIILSPSSWRGEATWFNLTASWVLLVLNLPTHAFVRLAGQFLTLPSLDDMWTLVAPWVNLALVLPVAWLVPGVRRHWWNSSTTRPGGTRGSDAL